MNVFKRAVLHWGPYSQLAMLQEECAEVIAAVSRFRRKRTDDLELIDEIADLKIMVQQMWEIFPEEILNEAYAQKVHRLHQRLDEEVARGVANKTTT